MKYDFIEIGTSDYDTLIQQCNDDEVGLSVEVVKSYIDRLPEKQNVKKINCGISVDEFEYEDYVYYVPHDIVSNYGLPDWMRGCNSVGSYHPLHIEHKIQHLVKKDLVKIIPIKTLFEENSVESVKYLKIDCEGYDSFILNTMIKTTNIRPQIIKFEANNIKYKKNVLSAIDKLIKCKYKITCAPDIYSAQFADYNCHGNDFILNKI